MNRNLHTLHEGELDVQRRMGSPPEFEQVLPAYISPDMPEQHAAFYAGLPYMAVATLDSKGRPWTSLLVTQAIDAPQIGIRVTGANRLQIHSATHAADPFVRALHDKHSQQADGATYFAGVGVDFSNRRRNKVAGYVKQFDHATDGRLILELESDQHLGNCPKYITVRQLQPYTRRAEVAYDSFSGSLEPLPAACKALIEQASTIFLATKHVNENNPDSDMGLNHRGGSPGFVRSYDATEAGAPSEPLSTTTYLVIPDHSGNRFYQSLGNIQSDPLVGITFPNFDTGDMLYITGIAENLFGDDAEALMPRTHLVTRIKVTGAVLLRGGLNLQQIGEEQFSPYNPPVRYLASELAKMGKNTDVSLPVGKPVTATLANINAISKSISTFSFELSAPVPAPLPGGFGIFDFSDHFDGTYRHMDEANPQAVNDDYLRTWTLSSAPNGPSGNTMSRVDITVKRQSGGVVSSYLHTLATPGMQVRFSGTGAGFSCFSQADDGSLAVPQHMLWMAGGVGITPFMAMWDALQQWRAGLPNDHTPTDIVLVFSGHATDLDVLRKFRMREQQTHGINLRILAFQTDAAEHGTPDFEQPGVKLIHRRADESDISGISHLNERVGFLCGPPGYMRHMESLIGSVTSGQLEIHKESFEF